MDLIGLYFKVENVIGAVPSNGTTKAKLAILAFFYCGEFVKNSLGCTSSNPRNELIVGDIEQVLI